jgi:hypothetical protein
MQSGLAANPAFSALQAAAAQVGTMKNIKRCQWGT